LVCLRGATSRWAGGFEIDNQALQVSAVRRIGDSLELRLWNPTDVDQLFALSVGQWQRVSASGTQCAGSTTLVKPHEIVTLRCRR
jgi:hypothetical protein